MASAKSIGFYWGEDKITLVEVHKNTAVKVISTPLGSKAGSTSLPFSSNFTAEIQVSAIFQKLVQDNKLAGSSFFVSLPVKEIILRSFIIPLVKPDEVQNAVKFEAKKYLPIDIQDLKYVFFKTPFTENDVKRLQIIFFAVRKETLDRYERVFKQVNAVISCCEPCMVSLTKVLLSKKELSPADHLPFLILDKGLGRICFIDRGVPQFIREFSISSQSSPEEGKETVENMNLKIVNEVGNSFDFYTRQFNGSRIDQLLVSSEAVDQDLSNALETELKLKLKKTSRMDLNQNGDMEAIYAMGACVDPPMKTLAEFNFLGNSVFKADLSYELIELLRTYKDIVLIFFICVVSLVGIHVFFTAQLKFVQKQYDQMSFKQGADSNTSVDDIKTSLQQNTDKLTTYKNIRMKSDVASVVLKLASHLPVGASIKDLNVAFTDDSSNNLTVAINISGLVFKEDPDEEIAVVNKIFSDIKNDKALSKFIKTVNLVSLNLENSDGKQVTNFTIRCN